MARQDTEDAGGPTAVIFSAVALAALLILLFVVQWGRDNSFDVARPAGTVESFLIAAAVDHDGFTACRYMSFHARAEVAALGRTADASCQETMSFARLQLGDEVVQQESQVQELSYAVRRSGRRAQVRVSGGGGATTFGLTWATPPELQEFRAPPTPWRIDSGIAVLLSRARR